MNQKTTTGENITSLVEVLQKTRKGGINEYKLLFQGKLVLTNMGLRRFCSSNKLFTNS